MCRLKCLKCRIVSLCQQFVGETLWKTRRYLNTRRFISRENPRLFYCTCDGRSRPKAIDPYGYHLVGRQIGANTIRLHDEVVAVVAKLFRTLRVDAIVEPIRLFADAAEDACNQ